MNTNESITAPSEIQSGRDRILELLSNTDITDFPELIKNYSLILGEIFKFDDTNEFFQSTKASEEYRKEFFKELVNRSNEILINELKEKGIKSVLFVTPTGMQGAGKGTNGDSNSDLAKIATQPSRNQIRNFFGIQNPIEDLSFINKNQSLSTVKDPIISKMTTFAKALDVKTGTGGIFFHADNIEDCKTEEEKEYFELFHSLKSAMGASGGKFVESNIVSISLNLYLAHKLRQSKDGYSTFNIDLYPRSTEQLLLLQELQEKLNENNISNTHKVIDYKILKQEEVDYLRRNKDTVVRLAKSIEKPIKNLYLTIERTAKADPEFLTFEKLTQIISDFFNDENLSDFYEEDNIEVNQIIVRTIKSEALEAIRRAKGRYEQGRKDDLPLPLLKRITDYLTKSYINAFEAAEGSLIMIPTNGDPLEVAQKAFCDIYGIDRLSPQLEPGQRYYHLLERFKDLVSRKVKGKFKTNDGGKTIVRESEGKTKFIETVRWDGDSVIYTLKTDDGKTSVDLRVDNKGVRWLNPRHEKRYMRNWIKLKEMGCTKNWSYDIKNLDLFKQHFRELRAVEVA